MQMLLAEVVRVAYARRRPYRSASFKRKYKYSSARRK
jgi:hypothetical protein